MITMYDYKRYANITDSENDGKIAVALAAALELSKRYTGLDLANNAKTVKLNPPTTDYLVLPDTNVSEVSSISLKGYGDWDENTSEYLDLELDSNEFYLEEAGVVELVLSSVSSMPTSKRCIEVTYSLDDAAPSDLKLAIFELTHYYYKREFNYSKDVGGESVDFNDDSILPTQVKTIFDMHRCL